MIETRPTPIVACLAGDGIGPEVMAEAGRVIETVSDLFGIRIRQVHLPFGGEAIDRHNDPFPSHVRAAVKASDAVLLGAVGGPRWSSSPRRPEQGLLDLRKELDAFANLRPVRHADIDLMVVRELTGGLYFGAKTLEADRAMDMCTYDRPQIERVARWAFRLARRRSGRVVSVDKQNVLATSKLWRRVVSDVHAAEYADVELTHELVDSFAMNLATRPQRFDVILTENLFGDILSDLAAAVGGGLGIAPSASLGAGGAGDLRAGARLGPRYRRPERGQPDRDDPVAGDDVHARPQPPGHRPGDHRGRGFRARRRDRHRRPGQRRARVRHVGGRPGRLRRAGAQLDRGRRVRRAPF